MNGKVGFSFLYDSYYKLALKIYTDRYGYVSNCLQAKGNLQQLNNEIITKESLAGDDERNAFLDAMYEVQRQLNQYIATNCNDSGVSTIVDVPPGTDGVQYVDPNSGAVTDDFVPEEKKNYLPWILGGVAVIGIYLYRKGKLKLK
jgi:hypothetical protein